MTRPARLLPLLATLLALAPLACDKGGEPEVEAPEAKGPADPFEATARRFLESLGSGDYGETIGMTASPLSKELSKAAYDDLSKIVAFLGEPEAMEVKEKKPVQGGQYRRYMLKFETGLVEYEVTVEYDAIVGFHLMGPGFDEAEHGVIAEQFREFKVYDFKWNLDDGTENPGGEVYSTNRIDWQIFVGGIEAMGGEHHITIEKICLDESGKELFHEPIEYDVKFEANAEGIPTGHVDGYLEVPGPGKYTLEIRLKDNIAVAEIDHKVDFEVKAE